MLALSVLDLSPVTTATPPAAALNNTLELARFCDTLGYTRYWLAEHHNLPTIASSAPDIMIGQVAAITKNMRIGSGGVMLPNHAPLMVIERFKVLEALFPGRIDLGLGRAPGTDQAAAYALRRNLSADVNQFPRDVVELMSYLKPDTPGGLVRAIPGEGLDIPVWILGSSLFGAQLAAMLGLPYAFASHFAPQMMMEAIEVYRHRFEPSEQLDKPYVMLGFNAIVADTDAEAELLATSVQQAFVSLRTGKPIRLPPPKAGYADQLPLEARAILRQVLSASAIGSPETARRQLNEFVERTRPDELMITAQVYDHPARLRSYELLMEAVRQPETLPAS
jgi:luciferase family oxidoreductase group 1